MFRLAPYCKSRRISKVSPSFLTHCQLYSAQIFSHDDRTRFKQIDFEILFRSCARFEHAKRLHALLLVSGNARSIFMSTRLVNLYALLGDVSLSRQTFEQIPNKDIYTWNSMVSAYVRNGHFRKAVDFFYHLLVMANVRPDFYTFPPVIKACGNVINGRKMHCWVLKLGFEWDVYVSASLIHMYTKFGLGDVALKLFNNMPFRDMGSWNAIISGLCQNGNVVDALEIVDEMRREGIRMDPVTVSSVLPIYAQLNDLLRGMLIHLYVIKHGLDFDVFVSNALINMYAKFGCLDQAQNIFSHMMVRDVVSWNSIIAAYEQNDDAATGLSLFKRMQLNGFEPDSLTLVSLASIVGQSRDCLKGKSIHGFTMRRGWLVLDMVIGNAVMDMYSKLGLIVSARKIFEILHVKDVISWNTLITGYAQNGLGSEAIEVYHMMEECKDIIPNQGTWVSILPAYSHVGALQQGMKIHGRVIKNSLYLDVFVSTCLIDMYGKCGRLDDALYLFYQVPSNSSVPWNAIISCHGIHGHGEKALKLFEKMREEKVKPDHVTFVSLLSACSHSGLINQGKWCFSIMREEYGIEPSLKHYGCMVDLLGRAGLLEMASDFIKDMPVKPDASIWGALLGACRIHKNVELGSYASDRLLEVDPENVGYYVLLSNIYANVGRWDGVNKVRLLATNRGLKKTPGWSSIEIHNKVDVFYTGNRSHPQCEEIYEELGVLLDKMKSLGYIPDYSFVLQDVEDDEKEHILTSHSERLAIAFGIINTPPGSLIRIFKNLRVCGDCHNATKYISKITEREIVVRDSNRFHLFKDGSCSCGDYWSHQSKAISASWPRYPIAWGLSASQMSQVQDSEMPCLIFIAQNKFELLCTLEHTRSVNCSEKEVQAEQPVMVEVENMLRRKSDVQCALLSPSLSRPSTSQFTRTFRSTSCRINFNDYSIFVM